MKYICLGYIEDKYFGALTSDIQGQTSPIDVINMPSARFI